MLLFWLGTSGSMATNVNSPPVLLSFFGKLSSVILRPKREKLLYQIEWRFFQRDKVFIKSTDWTRPWNKKCLSKLPVVVVVEVKPMFCLSSFGQQQARIIKMERGSHQVLGIRRWLATNGTWIDAIGTGLGYWREKKRHRRGIEQDQKSGIRRLRPRWRWRKRKKKKRFRKIRWRKDDVKNQRSHKALKQKSERMEEEEEEAEEAESHFF